MEYLMLLMILIWFLNALFSLVAGRFGLKVDHSRLNCGIVAFCGDVPANPEYIKLLLLYNEERGKDSTGWCVNDVITKDTEPAKKFLQDNILTISPEHENYSVVAHVRNGTSGTKRDKDLAHPFGMCKEAPKPGENKPYDVVLVMNGTLTNPDLIAKKYGLEFKTTNSDTQILSKIIAILGVNEEAPLDSPFIEVLKLLDGPATLVFYFPSMPNTLMVLRSVERTLHCYSPVEGQVYISSIDEPLKAIGGRAIPNGPNAIKYIESDTLILIKDGKSIASKKIIRTPLVNKTSRNSTYHTNYQGYPRDVSTYDSRKQHYQSDNDTNSKVKEIANLRKRTDDSNLHKVIKGNKAYTINERYFKTGHAMEGAYYLTPTGKIKYESDLKKSHNDVTKYFFLNGYMCLDEANYNTVIKRCSKPDGKTFDLDKFKSMKLSEFIENFKYPALTICDGKEVWLVSKRFNNIDQGEKITIHPFLSKEEFPMKKTDRWTINNKTYIATPLGVVDIESPLDESNFEDEETREKVSRFLFATLEKEENINPHKLFTLVRTDLLRENKTSGTLKMQFFTFVIDLAVKYEVLSVEGAGPLKRMFEEETCSGPTFDKEIKNIFHHLLNKMKAMDCCATDLITKINGFNNAEKIKLSKENPTIMTEEDVLASIVESNAYYSNNKFRQDIADGDYNGLDDFKAVWIAQKGPKEEKLFYEGLLLAMYNMQRVDSEELLLCIELIHSTESVDPDVIIKCEDIYDDWIGFLDSKPKKEDVEEASVETKDKDLYEEEFQYEATELFNGMSELAENIGETNSEVKSEKLDKLKGKIDDVKEYMKEHVLNN